MDCPQHIETSAKDWKRYNIEMMIERGAQYANLQGCEIIVTPKGEEIFIFFPNGDYFKKTDGYHCYFSVKNL